MASYEYKCTKYLSKLATTPVTDDKFKLYLDKINYWYNQRGGVCDEPCKSHCDNVYKNRVASCNHYHNCAKTKDERAALTGCLNRAFSTKEKCEKNLQTNPEYYTEIIIPDKC